MLLVAVIVPVMPLVLFSLLALRFGADSRDWRKAGDWDWLHRGAPDGTDFHV